MNFFIWMNSFWNSELYTLCVYLMAWLMEVCTIVSARLLVVGILPSVADSIISLFI